LKIDTHSYRVRPGAHVSLQAIDPEAAGAFEGGKREGKEHLQELNQALEGLQERLYAEQKHAVLIILQGTDTSGKDGTIEHVFEGVNPQGVRVASFKAPTPIELEHDFLWRVHQKTPGKGEIVIFNRSHYEDVLIVRVHGLVPEKVWSRRYSHINNFEKLLADEGTTILKFFLHINKEEQANRLMDRLDEPEKQWKFNPGDLKERKVWDSYQRAFEDALSMTSTDWAPWYVVPSNNKWFRNLLIASVLVQTLQKLNPQPHNPYTSEEIDTFREQLKKQE
jgi:PPK2 family polyphosphate:nucleotide phosphotransferase